MLSSLLSGLTSLRDFFSRAFFIAALIPSLLFVFINAAILYVWSWPVHDWIGANLLKTGLNQAIWFAVLFFSIWINAYLVSSLTPLWTRSLEGSNWWTWLRKQGTKYHVEHYEKLNRQVDEAVGIYANIQRQRPQWRRDIETAVKAGIQAGIAGPTPTLANRINSLQAKKDKNELILYGEIDALVKTQVTQIRCDGNTPALQELAGKVELLIEYAGDRALAQHVRAVNQRNLDFPEKVYIAPTRFGNVGQTAQAYAVRAYGCNLTHFWSMLRQIAQKDEATAKSLENIKSQLDFLVAGYWLSLTLAVEWAVIFAGYGEWKGAVASAIAGPMICWFWWYGAAVEQYRVLQDLIISCLNSYRFQVLTELHIGSPSSLDEERDLWRYIDLDIGNGENYRLDYELRKPA